MSKRRIDSETIKIDPKIHKSDPLDQGNFIKIGRNHIMDTPLTLVYQKTWLQKGDRNIFLIGELNRKRTHDMECTGMKETVPK